MTNKPFPRELAANALNVESNQQLKPLRFLSVANVPPDPNSGAAGTTHEINVALRKLGHSVDEIWEHQLGPRRIAHGNLHSLLEQPRRYADAIRRANFRNSYDVILSQQPQSYLAAREHRQQRRSGLFATVSQGVENRISPVLKTWRKALGMPAGRFPQRLFTPAIEHFLNKQWPEAAKWSDAVIVQHSQDRDFVCREYGLPASSVHVWASGLPEGFLEVPPRPMTKDRLQQLLFVGQKAFYKGPDFLARIINTVLSRHSQTRFTWVCGEHDHGAAKGMFSEEVRDRVILRPWGPQEELLNLLDTHGIFVFPTIAEGFAKAPLEAMSRGMCVVASDCCGMRDYLLNADSGYLVEVGNTEGFVNRIESLLAHPVESAHISGRARLKSTEYTWPQSAQQLAEFAQAARTRKADRR